MQWIKCLDRFPDNDDDVLVYNPKDGISTGHFDKKKCSGYIDEDTGQITLTKVGWQTDYEWAPKMNPTHWMPLPKEPKD